MLKLKAVEILLVEDTESDVRLVQEMFKDMKVANNLWVARDGQEASDFVFQRGKYTDAPRPDLILLDLNLPRKDGREVLNEVKTDPGLKSIPVIVLTSSRAEEDIARAYAGHANSYITKPLELDSFIEVVNKIENYWLSIVELPR